LQDEDTQRTPALWHTKQRNNLLNHILKCNGVTMSS